LFKISEKFDISAHQEKLQDIKKRLNKVLKDLEIIIEEKFDPFPPAPRLQAREIKHPDQLPPFRNRKLKKAKKYILEVIEMLEKAESLLPKRKKGRPEPDRQDLINLVASYYNDHLCRPTSYYDSPFYKIVCLILEKLDLPSKKPDRAIAKALRSIPT
jgi:hypothetical protein